MPFRGMEDRLNPITPEGADETTLGGYASVHGRAPGFEASDGSPYTVSIEAELSEDRVSWVGYLVFLRWAAGGHAIMGHLETDDLAAGATENAVRATLDSLPLRDVKAILEETIALKRELMASEAAAESEAPDRERNEC